MIKVQIIEDNFEQANMLAELLTNDNNIKIVNISGDSNVGKEMDLKLKPDVLILDPNLPGLTGNQLLNYLCNISYEERNKCNVIVVSGEYGNNPLKYTSKVYSCLTKPYDCKLIYYFIN